MTMSPYEQLKQALAQGQSISPEAQAFMDRYEAQCQQAAQDLRDRQTRERQQRGY